jgi:hypothetical protein
LNALSPMGSFSAVVDKPRWPDPQTESAVTSRGRNPTAEDTPDMPDSRRK